MRRVPVSWRPSRAGGRLAPALPARELLPFVLLAAAVLGLCLAAPLARRGDASDYILATESLLYDGDLRYTLEDARRHRRLKPYWFDSPAGLHTVAAGPDARYLGLWHSFYYPLVALPWYLAFGYRGFHFLNGTLFCLLGFLLFRHLRDDNDAPTAWGWALLSLTCSASWLYIVWIHPEIFLATLVGLFAFFHARRRLLAAAVCLGLGAGAHPILAPFAVAVAVLELATSDRRAQLWKPGLALLAAMAPAYVVNLALAGTIHPMLGGEGASGLARLLDVFGAPGSTTQTTVPGAGGAFPDVNFRSQDISLALLVRAWLDPAIGIVWFFPAIVPALLAAPKNVRTLGLLLGVVLATLASGSFGTFYSHQVGMRQGAFLAPVLMFLPRRVSFARPSAVAAWAWAVFLGVGLVANPIGNAENMDISSRWFLGYRLVKDRFWYAESRDVTIARLQPLSGTVRAAPIYDDGWTPGGEPIDVLVYHAHDRPVRLELMTGVHGELRIAGESGGDVRHVLRPGTNVIELPPAGPDLEARTPRGVHWDAVRLRLEATSWYPVDVIPGSTDPRRLGVRLMRVWVGGELRYARDAGEQRIQDGGTAAGDR